MISVRKVDTQTVCRLLPTNEPTSAVFCRDIYQRACLPAPFTPPFVAACTPLARYMEYQKRCARPWTRDARSSKFCSFGVVLSDYLIRTRRSVTTSSLRELCGLYSHFCSTYIDIWYLVLINRLQQQCNLRSFVFHFRPGGGL